MSRGCAVGQPSAGISTMGTVRTMSVNVGQSTRPEGGDPWVAGTFAGKPIRRLEDRKLLTGQAAYISNMRADQSVELSFIRSTVAHAHIISIDTSLAASMPGVRGVFVAADLGLAPAAGPVNEKCLRHPLAVDKVRFVGEPVAVVAADTLAEAVDAAEL